MTIIRRRRKWRTTTCSILTEAKKNRGVNQVVGPNKRGASTGFTSSMGQIGGIVSALAFPKKDGPMYVPVSTFSVSRG